MTLSVFHLSLCPEENLYQSYDARCEMYTWSGVVNIKRNSRPCSRIKNIPLLNNMEGKYRHKSTSLAFILILITSLFFSQCTITLECHALYCVHIHS